MIWLLGIAAFAVLWIRQNWHRYEAEEQALAIEAQLKEHVLEVNRQLAAFQSGQRVKPLMTQQARATLGQQVLAALAARDAAEEEAEAIAANE